MENTVQILVSPKENSGFLDTVSVQSEEKDNLHEGDEEDIEEGQEEPQMPAENITENLDEHELEDEKPYDHDTENDENDDKTEIKGEGNAFAALASVARTLHFTNTWINRARSRSARQTPRVDSFLEKLEMAGPPQGTQTSNRASKCVDPSQHFLYYWLIVVTVCVLYNWIFIIARTAFEDLQGHSLALWFVLDYACDVVYILDMVVQFKTCYHEQGILVKDPTKLRRNYMMKMSFKLDCLSMVPLDLFYLLSGTHIVALRFPRLLRLHRLLQLTFITETRSRFPNFLRMCFLVAIVLFIFHWNACFYFLLSRHIGLGSDSWVYPNLTTPGFDSLSRQYLFSLYWSSRMLTTGETDNPPQTNLELLFVTIDLTMGFLVFAAIVGQFGSMIIHMLQVRREFLGQAEAVQQYMAFHGVGKDLQRRVVGWFDYIWTTKKSSLDRDNVLCKLPNPLRTEIAVQVHLATLKRVQVFSDVEPGLLKEIVLKLRSQIYSPGDYICKKGEPGKEMYLVSSGRLQVVQDDGTHVIAILNEGSYFGEISILNVSNTGNRRTANVRSEGYSELLCLSKEDLLEALTEYPEARKTLEMRGRRLLRRSR